MAVCTPRPRSRVFSPSLEDEPHQPPEQHRNPQGDGERQHVAERQVERAHPRTPRDDLLRRVPDRRIDAEEPGGGERARAGRRPSGGSAFRASWNSSVLPAISGLRLTVGLRSTTTSRPSRTWRTPESRSSSAPLYSVPLASNRASATLPTRLATTEPRRSPVPAISAARKSGRQRFDAMSASQPRRRRSSSSTAVAARLTASMMSRRSSDRSGARVETMWMATMTPKA